MMRRTRRVAALLWVICAVYLCSAGSSLAAWLEPPLHSSVWGEAFQDASAQKLLDQVRSKRGLATRSDVKSLLLRTSRTLVGSLPDYETVRLLWPDRFQRVGSRTHTIIGDTYWQQPRPSDRALPFAERNTRGAFAEVGLVFLLRPLPNVVLEIRDIDRAPDRGLEFTGPDGFRRVLVIAPDLTVKAVEERGQLAQGGASSSVTRILAIEKYRQFDGIWFPVQMTEQIGTATAAISINDVLVDKGVGANDFAETVVKKED